MDFAHRAAARIGAFAVALACAAALACPVPALAAALADGTYDVPVVLEGGTGRTSLEPTAEVVVEGGVIEATVVFSSSNYDLMVVDGVEYVPVSLDPGSTFTIPVASLDEPLAVSAETTAMGNPHMIDYTITFDASAVSSAAVSADGSVPVAAIVGGVVVVVAVAAVFGIAYFRRKNAETSRDGGSRNA